MEGNFYFLLLRNVKMTHTDLEVIELDYVAEREREREREREWERETELAGTLQNNYTWIK